MRKCNYNIKDNILGNITKPQRTTSSTAFRLFENCLKITACDIYKVGGGFVIVFYLLANNLLSFSETNYLHLANTWLYMLAKL